MTLSIKHPFVSAIADDPASISAGEVVPTNWNASHTLNLASSKIIVGNGSNIGAEVAMSGAITINNTGVTSFTTTPATASFVTIDTPNGTDPVATTASDTLIFTNAESPGTITITGDSSTNTINFHVPGALVHPTPNVTVEYALLNTLVATTMKSVTLLGTNVAPFADSLINSVLIGDSVMSGATTVPGVPSSPNIMIGNNIATKGLYQGMSNIFLGTSILTDADPTANGCIVIGHASTIGPMSSDNIVFGNSAGNSSLGDRNVVIGTSAASASVGARNTIIGRAAGVSMGGSSNVAIGQTAMTNSVTGDNNVALGSGALSSCTSSNNIGIGSGSLPATSGDGNTVIGANSFTNALTISGSIAIGASAGSTAGGNSNIILIGNASEPSSGIATNEMCIGSDLNPITQLWFGNGGLPNGSSNSITFSPTAASGFNTAGSNFIITAGNGTGGGGSGNILLQTAPTAGLGTTPNILANTVTIANGSMTFKDAFDVVVGSTTGTKFGTSNTQKISFFNSTPIIQPVKGTAIDDTIVNLGLRASGGLGNFSTTIKPRTGGTAAGSEPIQFTSGSLLTSATAGTMEFLTDKYYGTITTGAARKEFALADIALTSGRVPFNTTNGRLTDSANITFDGTNLSLVNSLIYTSSAGGSTDGQTWNDSTQKSSAVFQDGIKQMLSGTIFTQTADQTVTNTVTETTILGTGVGTKTLPANFFVAGKTIRLRVGGIYSTPALATPSIVIKVKYGSTVIATVTTSSLLSGATTLEFDGEILITCRTTGSSGTVMTHGDIEYGTGVAGTISVDPLNNAGATTTINTTTSNALDVTITWDSATSTRIAKSTVCTIEVLN